MGSHIQKSLEIKSTTGIKLGRPKGAGKSKLDQYREEIIALLRNSSTKRYVAKKYGVTSPTLINWLRKNDIYAKPRL